MSGNVVAQVDVTEDTIRVTADPAFSEEFLRDEFWVTYDAGVDLTGVGRGLALVPFVANIAPIVWLSGMEVRVPVLDETFHSSLEATRDVLAGMYPSLRWEGSITAERLEPSDGPPEVATLFSGGVDSVYSVLEIGKPQVLVTVQGSDIALDNTAGWDVVKSQAVTFADGRGHRNVFVRSNFRRFLDVRVLESRWPEIEDWWNGVQHGTGLLTLSAPVVAAGRVVIAATHTPAFGGKAWGSNPALDTSIRWGGVEVDHHGYEATRQEKVEAIVADDGPPPFIRVCFSNHYSDGSNCERCEKCLRTFAALMVAGADPADHGFAMSVDRGARLIRRRFRTYRVAFSITKTWHWSKIQEAVAERHRAGETDPAHAEFLDWLVGFDFARYERRWKFFLRSRKRALRLLKRFPALERGIRGVLYGSRRRAAKVTADADSSSG